jgi:cytochrome c oxidase assembly protein subunit 15
VDASIEVGKQAGESSARPVAAWLLLCCALIFGMVVLGGVTRLTGSGLSMVRWNPIFGVVPPLRQTQWEQVFAQYQQSPEYREVNVGMDLAGFKRIYWVEYAHRLLGRLIGVVFLVPLLAFIALGRIPKGLAPRLAGVFVLGALQGLLGWYMVESGLVDNPHVSQYRLTAHLMLAVLIYGYLFWLALGLLLPRRERPRAGGGLRPWAYAIAALVPVTMTSGGFVAGLKAGRAYNTFPRMGDEWIPGGIGALHPWYRNLFENIATVQFDHRVLALTLLTLVVVFSLSSLRQALSPRLRFGLLVLLGVSVLQVTLGISTLLLHVPVPLASAHQAGALLVFTAALFVAHRACAA